MTDILKQLERLKIKNKKLEKEIKEVDKASIVKLRWIKATVEDRAKQGEVMKNNAKNFRASLSKKDLKEHDRLRGIAISKGKLKNK